MSDSLYMNAKQVAEYYSVCANTVRNWADAGYIQKHFLPTVGTRKRPPVRFLRSDVEKMARTQPWNQMEEIQA